MASDPDTTTERSHTTSTGVGPSGLAQHLLTRLHRSAKVAQPYMPWAAAGLAFGLPLLWLVWSWVEVQAWDSLAVRLAIGALCLPLVACRHWPAAWARALPSCWAAALMIAVPWHSTLLLVANGYGSMWLLNMLAGATALTVLQPLTTALGTFAVGSALGLLSVPILLHLQPELARPVPLNIVSHVLVLAIATALSLRLLQLARLRVRQPAGNTQPVTGATPSITGEPANRGSGLLSNVINNSIAERLAALEAEHGPVKARKMLNSQERRFVAMMHADIRGFARLVTSSNEADVAKLVSQSFAEITSVGQDLSVIKPIGDGLFLFADVQPHRPAEDAAVNVLCLASVFVAGVVNVNQTMAAPRGLPELTVGVGLHAGEAVYGNVSGPQLADLTVVGVAPNLTARLEELTKHPAMQGVMGPNPILMTEDFVVLLRKAGLSLPGMRLLDLAELEAPVRDFPAVSRVWGLEQQQALEFAPQARQRIKVANQARRASDPRPSVSAPTADIARKSPTADQALSLNEDQLDEDLKALSKEDLLELLPRDTSAGDLSGTAALRPAASEGFSLDGTTLESLINDASAAVVYVDKDWVARYCNATMASNLGLRPDQILGRTPFEYTPTDFKRSIFYATCSQCIEEQRAFSQIGYSTVLSRWLVVNGFPIRGGGLMVAYDASESAIKAYHLETSNAPDQLTGLRGKLALEQHVQTLLAKAEPCQLMLISLRKFRDINDVHGYGVGDLVLMQIASRLHSAAQPGEAVFRVGGDVFAWVMAAPPPIPQTSSARGSPSGGTVQARPAGHALERCRQLLALLQAPVVIEEQRIPVHMAIGVVSSPQDGDAYPVLFKRAGLALGEAKRQAATSLPIAAFTAALEESARNRLSLEQDLRRCLDGSQFELLLQPRVNMTNGSVLAAEALIRWRHPIRGELAPGEFLPLAREMGVMRTIDAWVLRQVIGLCVRLRDFGAPFPISCNLSDEALGDVLFSARLSRDLATAGVAPNLLEIEINEGDLMLDAEASLRTLQSLKQVGVRLAIDHFGTGYPSSFSHLSRFPIDTIKLDRSFVADLSARGHHGKFTRTIRGMAHSLAMDVVANCVETEAQVHKLQRLNFDGAQGFALATPMAWEEFLAFAAVRRIAADSRPNPLTL
jgi:predicted signal transduction protein with EAL and GGDEF domain/class 3 adenylate cyclase